MQLNSGVVNRATLWLCFAGSLWAESYGTPPLTFESRQSSFAARLGGQEFLFGASGAIWRTLASGGAPEPVLRFAHARRNVRPQADGPQAGTANYLVGAHPDEWRTGVPLFKIIRYQTLYKGIDLVYYGNLNRLEYDLVVAPGASWRAIRLVPGAAEAVEVGADGDLRTRTGAGWITHGRPSVYQNDGNTRRTVRGRYVLKGAEIGFDIGAFNPRLPLIIDPMLIYSSYLGGSGNDYGHAVAVDSAGCAYVVGETGSTNFPTLGPEQAQMVGGSNAFVTKWNPGGTGLVYSTYIGGSTRDVAMGVAVDAAGNAYVTGFTYSANFPVTSGALRSSFVGQSKAFALKLNPAGNGLVYSTFLGGSGADYGAGIAVDPAGEAHIAGYTSSVDFPTTPGAYQTSYGGGLYDGFLTKLNAAGSALVFSTYLGGSANDTAAAVALDPAGNIYVTGQTQSWNFPTLNSLESTLSEADAFVVKMNASGQVAYATFLGGIGLNYGTGIAADASGNAYVTGYTNAANFPVSAGTYQGANNGGYDSFVATLNPSGAAIVDATYYGGAGSDVSYGIALDSSGNVYIAGSTTSSNLAVPGAVQASAAGGGDAFVAAFDNQLNSLLYATYFGGSGSDVAAGIAVDSSSNAYITGWTNSGISSVGLPVTAGAFEPVGRGGEDAFLAKIASKGSSIACTTSTPQALPVTAGSSAQLLGNFLLSCSGGTAGSQITAIVQATLSISVVNAGQAELFVGSSATPVVGVAGGTGAITFQISFPAPGPSASTTLSITNVWANVSTLPVGAQVAMTVSASSPTAAITVTPAAQTLATVQPETPQLQQMVLSKASAATGCTAPAAAGSFLVSDAQALLWFEVAYASAGDVAKVVWNSPSHAGYQSDSFTMTTGGTECLTDSMHIAGSFAQMPGAWQVSLYWNNTLFGSASFTVSAVGVTQLIWQNNTTGAVEALYYDGAGGATYVGWSQLDPGEPGWTVVGFADMNGDGVPDLIWMNTTTRQVNVNYYGGPGGITIIGSANLTTSYNSAGWHVVAVADFDGNGTPDLVWESDAVPPQIHVIYYGGAGGAVFQGWANLTTSYNTTGWHCVAAADFNGDGVPDLVWQINDSTSQVHVIFYGGAAGAVFQGWANLTAGYNPAGWNVVAAADFNNNGIADLVWQIAGSTAQVHLIYYGTGDVFTGWANLTASYNAVGWTVVAAR